MTRYPLAIASAAAFVALVVASNWLTAEYGLIGGFVTAGTFTAGLVLAARDAVRETAGVWSALGCVAVGAGLSVFMSTPALALASGVAFAVSEAVDTLVYEPLRRQGRVRALAWSNLVGSVVDSLLFLTIAGFPLWPAIVGQVAVKWVMCVALPLLAIGGVRAVLRYRVRAEGA
ncbi:VUT family protein [Paractinoplanes rhizophilus]|uniref:VUT family protein n=1 Tax=Paractinoplanes rhizophilus TaxID=1416877 RepID=A0ABW2HXA7_9ACTN